MVVLGVEDQAELEEWETRLGRRGVKTAAFAEPDRDGEKTALAVSPAADPGLFKEMRLL